MVRPVGIYGPRSRYGIAYLLFNIAKVPVVPLLTTMDGHTPLIHVRDLCRASYFLSEREDTIGEIYNTVDDSTYRSSEIFKGVSNHIGFFTFKLWLPFTLVYLSMMLGAKLSRWIANIFNKRALIEQDMIHYLKFDFIFDNTKLKNLGFEFHYPDSIAGLIETINWYHDNGWLSKDKIYFKIKGLTNKKTSRTA